MQEAAIAPALCRYVPSTLFVQVANSKNKKLKRQQTIEGVVDIINAFLNEGKGVLCIHSEDSCFLDQFHQQLDDHLNSMLSDGSLFDENYELNYNFEVDPFRVVYRVKPRNRTAPITENFKTKGSLDKGVTNLVRQQVQTLLQKVSRSKRPAPSEMPRVQFNFVNKGEVEQFVENRYRQAKRFPTVHSGPKSRRMSFPKLVDSVWELVVNYISAFSKNEVGGSVFFGISEEKDEPAMKWSQVREKKAFIEILDTNWKVWTNTDRSVYYVAREAPTIPQTSVHDPSSNYSLAWERVPRGEVAGVVKVTDARWQLWEDPSLDAYHVATEACVPVLKEQPTGRFVCEGLRLSDEERKRMKETILRNVSEKLMWLCLEAPKDPVTVTFHQVQDGQGHEDVYVMEVVVKNFHGIVFTDTVGPKAVKIDPKTREVVPMEFSEWLNGQRTEAKLQNKTPIFTSS
ncbi:MAG: hypothetical protein LGB71_06925 [Sulfurovum sp.]|nr:hypothetical protein [Sulfurovum sp.]